ncbi:MAG: hypothetical protein Unbinned1473contig1001_26 [Prokaryotic dsDNA virus sp.]|nr:MAG: hypothetical protein Unbinned1473contig1001_26 [Prokaryotic dsDNA virus sp.]
MIDPVSITAAYTAVKKGIEVGKDITQLMSEIGSLWTAIEEVETGYRKEKQKKQSVEEEALDLFAAKCAAKDAEENLRNIVIATRGFNAWNDMMRMRVDLRKKRKALAAQKAQEKKELLETIMIIGAVLGASIIILVTVYLFTRG